MAPDRSDSRRGVSGNAGGAMLRAAPLWQKTSARGSAYLTGRLGGVKVLIMPKREGEDGDHTHVLYFANAAPAPQRDAERGAAE